MSCATNKLKTEGTWISRSIAPWGPEEIMYIQEDSTYIKVYSAINGGYWEGKWDINGDTLFLEDIYDVGKTMKKLVDEDWHARRTKYIRQGKVWCHVDDIDKPKKRRYILEKNDNIKKEDLLDWAFRSK